MKMPSAAALPLRSPQASPAHGIAVDATSVYWANNGGGTVMRCPSARHPYYSRLRPDYALGIALTPRVFLDELRRHGDETDTK